ncbi:MAG: carboxypeptidase regulatory-like domain-containing protein, partial [Armatimonadota bacterium]
MKGIERGQCRVSLYRRWVVSGLSVACLALMLIATIASSGIAANMIADGSFNSIPSGINATDTGVYQYGGYWYYQNNAGIGTLNMVTPGADGTGQAVKLTRSSSTGWLGMASPCIPVVGGHTYRFNYWVRSDDATSRSLIGVVASFQNSDASGWDGNTTVVYSYSTSQWTEYSAIYTAPTTTRYAQIQFQPSNFTGTVEVDNASLEDGDLLVGNLIPNPGFENFPIGGSWTTSGTVCGWSFNSPTGTNATLSTVTPGRDGTGRCIELAKPTSGTSPSMAIVSYARGIEGHSYRLSLWARTDEATPQEARGVLAMFNSSGGWLGNIIYANFFADSVWRQYTCECVAPATTAKIGTQLYFYSVGSVQYDDLCLTDVTASSLTGTVVSALSGSPISGATVSITSNGMTLSTTTNSSGVYTFSNLTPADYVVTVATAGYTTSSKTLTVIESKTQDFGLVPDVNTSWTITDTFTRPANTDLGHTEDANAIPWVKTAGNTSSAINGDGKLQVDSGGVAGGACLGRGFAPTNFDMSV